MFDTGKKAATLVAAVATLIMAASASAATTNDRSLSTFRTPSGAVRCTINTQRVVCATIKKPLIGARLRAGKKAERRPAITIKPGAKLPYGQTTTISRFSCASTPSGVRCRDRQTNHAFLISRLAVKLLPAPVKRATPAKPPSKTGPRLGTCAAVRAAGLGPYRRGVDPEYNWYRDADGDGLVCE